MSYGRTYWLFPLYVCPLQVSDKVFDAVVVMSSLTSLSLADTNVTAEGLRRLAGSPAGESLRSLNLFYTPAADTDISPLAYMTSLTSLNIDGKQSADRSLPCLSCKAQRDFLLVVSLSLSLCHLCTICFFLSQFVCLSSIYLSPSLLLSLSLLFSMGGWVFPI